MSYPSVLLSVKKIGAKRQDRISAFSIFAVLLYFVVSPFIHNSFGRSTTLLPQI